MLRTSLLLLVLFAPAALCGMPCGQNCKFRLCSLETGELRKELPRVLIRPSGRFTLSGSVCRPETNLGLIRETGEAILNDTTPISEWRPANLDKPFRADFFRVGTALFRSSLQGIARTRTSMNQRLFLDNLCVSLPIVKWDIVAADGTVMSTQMGGVDDCVAFRTRYPEILVELQWDSSDDLDVSLFEPGGGVIRTGKDTSEAGRLNNDNGVGVCDLDRIGREAIIYDAKNRDLIEGGEYTFKVRHKFNCGDGETRWVVRVMVKDKLVFTDRGTSNLGNNAVITTGTFVV